MKKSNRPINTGFWTSPKMEHFTSMDRFLFLYLMTNPHASLCGCYEISLRLIAHETGLGTRDVREGVKRLEKVHHVVTYDEQTKTVLIENGLRQFYTSSAKLEKRLRKEIGAVKRPGFRIYLLSQLLHLHDESEEAKRTGDQPSFRRPPFTP